MVLFEHSDIFLCDLSNFKQVGKLGQTISSCQEIEKAGPGELALWITGLVARSEDLGSVFSIYVVLNHPAPSSERCRHVAHMLTSSLKKRKLSGS